MYLHNKLGNSLKRKKIDEGTTNRFNNKIHKHQQRQKFKIKNNKDTKIKKKCYILAKSTFERKLSEEKETKPKTHDKNFNHSRFRYHNRKCKLRKWH